MNDLNGKISSQNLSFNFLRNSVRLQGQAFRKRKFRLVAFGYSITDRGNICVIYKDKYTYKNYTHFLNDLEKESFNPKGLTKYNRKTKEEIEEEKRAKELKRLKKEEEKLQKQKEEYHQPHRTYYVTRSTAYILDGLLIKWRYFSYSPSHIDRILHEKASTCERVTEEEMEYILTFENVVIEDKGSIQLRNFTLPRYGQIKEPEE